MTVDFRGLEKKFLILSKRERLILIVMVVAVFAFFLQVLVVDVLAKKRKEKEEVLERLNTNISNMQQDIKLLTFSLQVGPDREERQRIVGLEVDVNKAKKSLSGELNKLISSEKMPSLIKEMLEMEDSVELISLNNLPVEKLIKQKTEKNRIKNSVGLYKHSFELIVRGRYLDIYQFLEKVKKAPWQFFWDEMDYTVDNFPKAQVKFTVSTLSTNEAWIGL